MTMAEGKGEKDGKRRWWQRISFKKLNRKYVFLMSHEETMEPIVDFRVNLMNIIIIAIASIVCSLSGLCIVSPPSYLLSAS